MSGPLTVPFTIAGLFVTAPTYRILFGILAVIAGITTCYRVWAREFERAEDAEAKLANALAGPDITGHFYQFQMFPRIPLPLDMMQQVLDRTNEEKGLPKEDYVFDCDVFVEAYIVNRASAQGDIIEYALELRVGGQAQRLKRVRGFKGWKLEDAEEKPSGKPRDLGSFIAGPALEQGKGVLGWLHFEISDINKSFFDGTRKDMVLIITDGYGKEHRIVNAWEGEARPFKMTWDFADKK